MSVVYAEDNPLWVLVYFLLTVALFAVVAFLGAFYLGGLYFARRLDRWIERRE